MNILMVYPKYPDTFWSFKHAIKLIRKKAAFPPLGLLTIASMLPNWWNKKVVDMNVEQLSDKDIKWADYVFISAMVVQKDSVRDVIKRAKDLGVKTVAGGPLFTTEPENFSEVDYLVLNEAEITLPRFLDDLANGKPEHIYQTDTHPKLMNTPIPMWSLINPKNYSSMSVQYSRGCPFNCEFCDIVFLDGHVPRTKGKEQIAAELEALYKTGHRGSLFIVDDNFIGNKNKLKREILPEIIDWQKSHNYPFSLFTEASINMVDDPELMRLIVKAGFNKVFIGIETPNEACLTECNKSQNTGRDLVMDIKKIHNYGLEVMAGFIVGFDNDPVTIFKDQINFIQQSGIVTAMVGLLNAPKGTRLYQRLASEKRLLKDFTGNNMDFSLNFIPKMKTDTLISGYRRVLSTIYSPKEYYDRIKVLLKDYKPHGVNKFRISRDNFVGLFNCVWFLGIRDKGKRYFWKSAIGTLFTKPRSFPLFMTLAAYGYHFRRVIRQNYSETAPMPV